MATTTVKLLHLRSGYRPITTSPTPIRFFSSSNPFETPNESSTQPNSNSPPPPPPQSQSPYTNYLSDVKARLKQQQPGNTRSPGTPFGFSSNIKDVEEMRKRLSEFRQRFPVSSPPSPPSSTSQSSQHISLGKIYERVTSGGQESSSAGSISYGKHSWLDIKEKLNKVRNTTPKNQNDKVGRINDSMSLSRYQESLSLKPGDRSEREPMVIGGGANLASSIFAKELGEKQGANVNGAVGIQFAKIYKPEDLGEKLRSLRPEKKGKNWFSLEELNERLKKVREIDEEESKSATGETQIVRALKDSLVVLSNNIEIEKGKAKNAAQKMDILAQLGRTPSYTSSPPQEHLVKQFFHPDNMSASEKLKLELKKVRDEFKMSESDCGSARVQVAQLTTKIKHLSAVLHKKDKHSKKGLQGMVQQRKKLLKYLRRTDWESYCFVLTKLGLRDNPDYKS